MRNVFRAVLILLLSVYAVQAADWEDVTDPYKVFEAGYIQAVGVSETGQSSFAALRSAEVVAKRKILEVLQGITLHGQTTVRDGMLKSDEIQTVVKGVLQGAVQCGEQYNPAQRYAKVCVKLYLNGKGALYDKVYPMLKEKNLVPQEGTGFVPSKLLVTSPASTASGSAERPASSSSPPKNGNDKRYDGLIVDVQDYSFKPAVINRIVTDKEEVLFEPGKIASQVLIERGAGGFTKDMNKAKALLQNWGSTSPMIIKSRGLVKATDVKVSADDAERIYVQDEKANILAQARVVYLLK